MAYREAKDDLMKECREAYGESKSIDSARNASDAQENASVAG